MISPVGTTPHFNVAWMRYGICLANLGTYSDPHAVIRMARAAEESGWESVFVWDHLSFVWGPPAADPWVLLTAIAAATERVRLGPAITPVARRRPQVLAQTVATLDVLSGGRVVFGAGLGGREAEFGKFGEPTDAKVRAAMLDEGLDLLRRFWSGEEVDHRGEHYTVAGVTLAPTPLQERLPVWIGGNKKPSLLRASRWDGWIADAATPTGMTLSAADVARSIELIGRGDDYDVAVLGQADLIEPAAYAEVGATWWLENIHDRRGSPDEMLELVTAGPPPG
jgi:alkanesulfonate monooxygenase SsuD/methylene tetrahydromethanopterin reductase-like flavin-dependent oxidoreductase (luciferase family)